MRTPRFLSPFRRAISKVPEGVLASVLWLLTFASTTFVGTITYASGSVLRALWFSVPLMTILTCHELGHYLQLRRYRLSATLPRFIPLPLPPLGSFGAVLRIHSPIPDRRVLFDVGASGPAAGLAAALVFLCVGLFLSHVATQPPRHEVACLTFGAPAIMQFLARSILGAGGPDGRFVLLHPCAIAGWVGLFLTSLNLLPIGQLDGGHVVYSLLGKRLRHVSKVVLVVMCVAAVAFRYWGWFVFVGLLAFFGLRHYPTQDDAKPLGAARAFLAAALLAYLSVGVILKPIEIDETAPVLHVAAAEEDPDPQPDGPLVFHVGLDF